MRALYTPAPDFEQTGLSTPAQPSGFSHLPGEHSSYQPGRDGRIVQARS
jgi:hypothetical protein